MLAADTLISKGSPPDGKNHPLHTNPALDAPEPEDDRKPFHTPKDGSTTSEQRKRFYDSLYDRLQAMAKRLDIKVEWLLGLAAWESGWLDEHNWPMRNPFGLTDAGGPNLRFNAFRSAIDYWEKLFGPRVKGAKTVDAFLDALGPQKGRPDLPAYNSVSKGWRSGVKSCINSQAHFIATWTSGKST